MNNKELGIYPIHAFFTLLAENGSVIEEHFMLNAGDCPGCLLDKKGDVCIVPVGKHVGASCKLTYVGSSTRLLQTQMISAPVAMDSLVTPCGFCPEKLHTTATEKYASTDHPIRQEK